MDDPNLPKDITKAKADSLLTRLVNSVDWHGLSLIGIGQLIAKRFSTSFVRKGQRTELDNSGIKIYDNYGNLIIWLSGDVTATNPITPTVVSGSGFFVDLIRSIATALTLSSKTGKALLSVSDGGNGILTFVGDSGSGNLQLSINIAAGLVFTFGSVLFKVTTAGVEINTGSIFLDDARKVGTTNTYIRFREGGSNGFVFNIASGGVMTLDNTALTLPSGAALQIGDTYTADGTLVADGYLIIKDSTGTAYKVLVQS